MGTLKNQVTRHSSFENSSYNAPVSSRWMKSDKEGGNVMQLGLVAAVASLLTACGGGGGGGASTNPSTPSDNQTAITDFVLRMANNGQLDIPSVGTTEDFSRGVESYLEQNNLPKDKLEDLKAFFESYSVVENMTNYRVDIDLASGNAFVSSVNAQGEGRVVKYDYQFTNGETTLVSISSFEKAGVDTTQPVNPNDYPATEASYKLTWGKDQEGKGFIDIEDDFTGLSKSTENEATNSREGDPTDTKLETNKPEVAILDTMTLNNIDFVKAAIIRFYHEDKSDAEFDLVVQAVKSKDNTVTYNFYKTVRDDINKNSVVFNNAIKGDATSSITVSSQPVDYSHKDFVMEGGDYFNYVQKALSGEVPRPVGDLDLSLYIKNFVSKSDGTSYDYFKVGFNAAVSKNHVQKIEIEKVEGSANYKYFVDHQYNEQGGWIDKVHTFEVENEGNFNIGETIKSDFVELNFTDQDNPMHDAGESQFAPRLLDLDGYLYVNFDPKDGTIKGFGDVDGVPQAVKTDGKKLLVREEDGVYDYLHEGIEYQWYTDSNKNGVQDPDEGDQKIDFETSYFDNGDQDSDGGDQEIDFETSYFIHTELLAHYDNTYVEVTYTNDSEIEKKVYSDIYSVFNNRPDTNPDFYFRDSDGNAQLAKMDFDMTQGGYVVKGEGIFGNWAGDLTHNELPYGKLSLLNPFHATISPNNVEYWQNMMGGMVINEFLSNYNSNEDYYKDAYVVLVQSNSNGPYTRPIKDLVNLKDFYSENLAIRKTDDEIDELLTDGTYTYTLYHEDEVVFSDTHAPTGATLFEIDVIAGTPTLVFEYSNAAVLTEDERITLEISKEVSGEKTVLDSVDIQFYLGDFVDDDPYFV